MEYFYGDGTSIELGGTQLSWIYEICWADISGNINKTGYCKIVGCLGHQMAEGESNNNCCWGHKVKGLTMQSFNPRKVEGVCFSL